MQPRALFDLDDTLVDRRAAFRAWAEEFVTDHGLDDKALSWLLFADTHSSGRKDGFFTTVRDEFNLAEPADLCRSWRMDDRRRPGPRHRRRPCRWASDNLAPAHKGSWSFVAATPGFIADSVSGAVELLLRSH
jgi:phosphoglycolate phosphatase-like HAD superfamily hydrolase